MDFIERLQSKSPEAKASYAFFGALLVTGVITVVWATTIPARFKDSSALQAAKPEQEKPFEDVTALVQDTKDQLGAVANWDKKEETTEPSALDTLDLNETPTLPDTNELDVVERPDLEKKTDDTRITTKMPSAGAIVVGTTTGTGIKMSDTVSDITNAPPRIIRIATTSKSAP